MFVCFYIACGVFILTCKARQKIGPFNMKHDQSKSINRGIFPKLAFTV